MNAQDLTPDSPADDMQPTDPPDGEMIAFRLERERGGLFVMKGTAESVRRISGTGLPR